VPERGTHAICDANVLIDFVDSDDDIIREMSGYFTKVYVTDLVLNEVEQLTPARADQLGLVIIETPIPMPRHENLSIPDSSCYYYAIKEKWTLIGNDTKLRRECKKQNVSVIWGLEMLLRLVSDGRISPSRAKDIACDINQNNPEITGRILTDFMEKLKKG
jgi:rRNA-processing protein FCF1